jgi:LPXTG-motif cell wall-anchored protein
MAGGEAPPTLARVVSRWEIVAISVNQVVGSGVYLLPAAAAAVLGATSLVAVVAAGAAVSLVALCFAEASSHFDAPGGAYLYAREAFGPLVACEVGWMCWLTRVAAVASLANGMALATGYLWPAAASGWGRAALVVLPLALLAWINVVGAKAGARAAVVLVIAKGLPLLFFVAVGLWSVDVSVLSEIRVPSTAGLGRAALLLLFAFAGFENAPAAAGEYRNPRRDVPFAMLATVAIVTLLYAGVQLVALGTLPDLAHATSPLAAAAGRFAGPGAALLLTVGALVSMLGTNASATLAGPRYLLALAADGFGPRTLGRVHSRFRTPAVAILVQTGASMALALTGTFVALALLSVIARLLTYVSTVAAVPVLRRKRGSEGTLRLPGGALIPAAALLVSLGLLGSSSPASLAAGGVALLAGAGLFLFRRKPGEAPAVSSPS